MSNDTNTNTEKKIITSEEAELKYKIQKALEAERAEREELEKEYS